ncbi:hypothetical protein VYU27_002953 [Nannochloropsis oceanica]
MPTDEEEPAAETAANARPVGKRKRKQKRKLAAARPSKPSPQKKAKPSASAEAEKQLHQRGAQAAKEYLELWSLRERGGGWKFHTKRQVWILKHMYTKSTIDKKFFNNLVLPYVSTLRGGAKERVLAEAEGYLLEGRKRRPGESDDENDEAREEKNLTQKPQEGDDEVTKQARRKRARKIVAVLSRGGKGMKHDGDNDLQRENRKRDQTK